MGSTVKIIFGSILTGAVNMTQLKICMYKQTAFDIMLWFKFPVLRSYQQYCCHHPYHNNQGVS